MIRTVTALVMKEFHQVMRDRIMLRMIFIIPVVQLILLGYVINTDVKNIPTALYDCDHSRSSRDLARSFSPGGYFILSAPDTPLLDAERDFERNRFTATLIIPEDFSEQLDQRRRVTAALIVDGANANSAGLTIGYANIIAAQFNRRLAGLSAPITLRQRMLYNPEAESVNFMVPGIVALLLTMITTMLTSMAIVREREAGTLEQLMVTPIPTPALILGKTIPFAILGFIEMSIALAIGILWFAIPFAGSWLLLYTLSFLYLFTTLGVGMFVSTISKTQQ
jgi:ABC-2 type transport system permease protein